MPLIELQGGRFKTVVDAREIKGFLMVGNREAGKPPPKGPVMQVPAVFINGMIWKLDGNETISALIRRYTEVMQRHGYPVTVDLRPRDQDQVEAGN